MSVVDTSKAMDYAALEKAVEELSRKYPRLESFSAGKSVMGRELFVLKLGCGPHEVFLNASHHALEWITTLVLMRFAEEYLTQHEKGLPLKGYDTNYLFKSKTIYLMPMVNPDGVDLVLNGIAENNPFYEKLLSINDNKAEFTTWQSNIQGVDLNHNYPAGWEFSKRLEEDYGICGPGPTRFSGEHPESEPETKAVCTFVRSRDIKLAVALHSQGEVIYYTYGDKTPKESRAIADIFSQASGYELSEPEGIAQYAGFKDWFICEFGRPGFTIEVGKGENPLPIADFDIIYKKAAPILVLSALV